MMTCVMPQELLLHQRNEQVFTGLTIFLQHVPREYIALETINI